MTVVCARHGTADPSTLWTRPGGPLRSVGRSAGVPLLLPPLLPLALRLPCQSLHAIQARPLAGPGGRCGEHPGADLLGDDLVLLFACSFGCRFAPGDERGLDGCQCRRVDIPLLAAYAPIGRFRRSEGRRNGWLAARGDTWGSVVLVRTPTVARRAAGPGGGRRGQLWPGCGGRPGSMRLFPMASPGTARTRRDQGFCDMRCTVCGLVRAVPAVRARLVCQVARPSRCLRCGGAFAVWLGRLRGRTGATRPKRQCRTYTRR